MIKAIKPSDSINVPIAIFNVFVGSFLTLNVEKGTDNNTPIINEGARSQFTATGETTKTITPTINVRFYKNRPDILVANTHLYK